VLSIVVVAIVDVFVVVFVLHVFNIMLINNFNFVGGCAPQGPPPTE
jgi:hypothetical protein